MQFVEVVGGFQNVERDLPFHKMVDVRDIRSYKALICQNAIYCNIPFCTTLLPVYIFFFLLFASGPNKTSFAFPSFSGVYFFYFFLFWQSFKAQSILVNDDDAGD